MNTTEKIEAIEGSGLQIVYDGCHKIYFLTDEEHARDAVACGYEPVPATNLRKFILASCPLVLVSKFGLNNDDFAHEWNIPQFTDDLVLSALIDERFCPICGKPVDEPVHDEECFK